LLWLADFAELSAPNRSSPLLHLQKSLNGAVLDRSMAEPILDAPRVVTSVCRRAFSILRMDRKGETGARRCA
jgi:hypothetical protein